MVIKILFPDATYFELKVLIAECATPESHEKKSVEYNSKTNKDDYFQSYLSIWLLCYHDNYSTKYHFQIQLISN
jgi:hypothetical protein